MKPELILLGFLLTLVIHTHARIFPYSSSELIKEYHKTKVDMIIRTIYWRPARSPPPAPTSAPSKKQSTLSDCNDKIAEETNFIINNNINNNNCKRIIRSPPPPTPSQITLSHRYYGPTKEELSWENRLRPPPPPIGSTPTGHLTPVTLCVPGGPCEGGDHYFI